MSEKLLKAAGVFALVFLLMLPGDARPQVGCNAECRMGKTFITNYISTGTYCFQVYYPTCYYCVGATAPGMDLCPVTWPTDPLWRCVETTQTQWRRYPANPCTIMCFVSFVNHFVAADPPADVTGDWTAMETVKVWHCLVYI